MENRIRKETLMAMSDYSLSDIAAVSENAGGFGNNGDGW